SQLPTSGPRHGSNRPLTRCSTWIVSSLVSAITSPRVNLNRSVSSPPDTHESGSKDRSSNWEFVGALQFDQVSAVAGAAASQPSNRHKANIGCFSRNFAFTGCVLLRRSIASGRRSWCLETISEQPGGTLHGADIAMMATRARTAALIHGRTIDIRTGVQCRAAHVD